jgi:hypothetical protein
VRGLLSLTIALVPACGGSLSLYTPPPSARVRVGPAGTHVPRRALSLPATCVSPFPVNCIPQYTMAVDNAARSALEFAGYVVLDGENVNPFTRERVEVRSEHASTRAHAAGSVASAGEGRAIQVTGGSFRDASPGMQRAVLDDMVVDTLVDTTLTIGAGHDINGEQTVEVALSVVRVADAQLVWASRCMVLTGLHNTLDLAVEKATRCAADSAFAVRGPVEDKR